MSKFVVLLCLFFTTLAYASEGDLQPHFTSCVDKCVQISCASPIVPDLRPQLVHWTCPENCRYDCMQSITPILQYYGKWPLFRLFGIQEPASVIFSLGNFCVDFYFCIVFYRTVPFSYRLKGFMVLYTILGMHAWIWSTLFHARDTKFTELMDSFSAGLFVLYSFYFALLRVFRISNGSVIRWLGTCFICLFVAHVGYMIIVTFNYTYNMYANVIIRGCRIALWVAWFAVQVVHNHVRPYAYLAVISSVGVAFAMCLELVFDFPPLWRVFDAHSLWHLSTIPLSIIWYRFLIKDMHYETKQFQHTLLNKI